MRVAALLLAAWLLTAAAPAPASGADESRAHALFRQIRCVVCQNESIDESDATLASDLRALVRREMAAGRSDSEIKRALTDRYGEFVLLRPRVSAGNALLWGAPFLLVLGGLGAFALQARSRREAVEPALSAEEEARLAALAPSVTVPPQRRPTDTTSAV